MFGFKSNFIDRLGTLCGPWIIVVYILLTFARFVSLSGSTSCHVFPVDYTGHQLAVTASEQQKRQFKVKLRQLHFCEPKSPGGIELVCLVRGYVCCYTWINQCLSRKACHNLSHWSAVKAKNFRVQGLNCDIWAALHLYCCEHSLKPPRKHTDTHTTRHAHKKPAKICGTEPEAWCWCYLG